jgi:hypothetical protein
MSFINSRNKFEKLWTTIVDNREEIDRKTNQLLHWLALPEYQKSQVVLYESEWTPYATTINSSLQTTSKEDLLPTYINCGFSQVISIPETFLPFIDVQLITKKNPLIKFSSLAEYITSTWVGNYYECYGNGSTLIYKGRYNSVTFREFYVENGLRTHEELQKGNFLISLTKKFWETTCYYSIGGNEYKAKGTITIIRYEPSYVRRCSPVPGNGYFNAETYFISMSNINITAYFGSGITETVPIVDASTIIRVKGYIYQKIGGIWTQIGITVDIVGNTISAITNIFNTFTASPGDFSGYMLFLSTDYKTRFFIETSTDTPYFFPPNIPFPLPYIYLTWKFNPSSYPYKLESSPQIITSTQNLSFFKHYIDFYRVSFSSKLYYLQKATEIANTTIFDKFNDTYNGVGNTYVLTIQSHTTETTYRYRPLSTDVEIKYKIIFFNPLYFLEGKKINGIV